MACSWFKNLYLLKLSGWKTSADELEGLLSKRPLLECGGSDEQSFGWVPPKPGVETFVHRNQEQMLIALGAERRLLPAAVVDQYSKARAEEIGDQRGGRVGRKEMKEIKEAVTLELLPRAFALRSQMFAWINPIGGWLVINASGESAANEVIEALRKAMGNEAFSLELVSTVVSPSAAMTGWLAGGDAPEGFTVDQDCELAGVEKASVKYSHHDLGAEDIPAHIAAGKSAVRLAMTWRDKISFVLTDGWMVKRVAPLDVIKEQGADAEDMFDGDFAIMSGELGLMLGDLVGVMGGLVGKEVGV